MVFITADTHGDIDIRKLSSKNWPEGRTLTKNDYLIIAGDFGVIWTYECKSEKYWLKWLDDKPWTTLVVDGNHENHDRLAELPVEAKFQGTVGKISESVFHLKRSQIYRIENKSFFIMGGAKSVDKKYRKPGKSWWPNEMPSPEEKENGYRNLEAVNGKVDFIVSHTAPETLIKIYFAHIGLSSQFTELDPTRFFLDDVFRMCLNAEMYCGHWHDDWDSGRFHMLYRSIRRIV